MGLLDIFKKDDNTTTQPPAEKKDTAPTAVKTEALPDDKLAADLAKLNEFNQKISNDPQSKEKSPTDNQEDEKSKVSVLKLDNPFRGR